MHAILGVFLVLFFGARHAKVRALLVIVLVLSLVLGVVEERIYKFIILLTSII